MKEDSLDSIIEQTLADDAERLRSSDETVPPTRLTARLAEVEGPRRGLGIGAKFAIFTGGALLVGAALYFAPYGTNSIVPETAVPNVSRVPISPSIPQSASPEPTGTSTAIRVLKPISNNSHDQQSAARISNPRSIPKNPRSIPKEDTTSIVAPLSNPIQADNADGKDIKRIRKQHYDQPIK